VAIPFSTNTFLAQ